jgi:hypothetical protein
MMSDIGTIIFSLLCTCVCLVRVCVTVAVLVELGITESTHSFIIPRSASSVESLSRSELTTIVSFPGRVGVLGDTFVWITTCYKQILAWDYLESIRVDERLVAKIVNHAFGVQLRKSCRPERTVYALIDAPTFTATALPNINEFGTGSSGIIRISRIGELDGSNCFCEFGKERVKRRFGG